MTYLLLIIASIALFAGFFALTMVEARTGSRVLAPQRMKLDRRIGRIAFIIKHVNWMQFFTHALQGFFERVAHDVVHTSLLLVRFIERELTDAVKYLRNRRPNLLAPQPSRTPILTQVARYVRKTFRNPRRKPRSEEE